MECESFVFSKKQLIEIFHLHKTVLNRILEYLNIQGERTGNFLYFSESDKNQIENFLKEHPNTRVFFQQQTFLKKYGVANPQQCEKIKEKTNQAIKEKYGVDNLSQSIEIKKKKQQTLQKHYGKNISNPMDSEIIRQKVIDNWKNKSTEEKKLLLLKRDNGMVAKYGTTNPYNIQEIKEKSLEKRRKNKTKERDNLEKIYGKLWSIIEICQSLNRCKDRIYDVIKELNLPILTIKDSFFITSTDYDILKNYFEIAEQKNSSNEENALADYIGELYQGEIIRNDKSIINPYELDIYLPDKNLAFEFNGIYYHSNLFKDKWYHYKKTKECEKKNIRLIHIYEDDWRYRTDIVKSIIQSSLEVYVDKIYARKCEIKEIEVSIYRTFMEKNHLQGFAPATHYLGLFYRNKLVQCIGLIKNGLNNHWELNRMATLLNTQVLGGFSKLVKYGIKKFNIDILYSYVFKAWFNGKGYRACGFEFDYECPPTYWYLVNGQKTNRMNYKKSKIKQKYLNGELNYYNNAETEQDNMAHNGISWIWDCGKIRLKLDNTPI